MIAKRPVTEIVPVRDEGGDFLLCQISIGGLVAITSVSHHDLGYPTSMVSHLFQYGLHLPDLSVSSDSEFWRCVLDKVRLHFELNPDESY